MAPPLLYGQIMRTHPEYDAEGWAVADVLYAGGKKLKAAIRGKDKAVVDMLFPCHVGEEDMVYEERRKRAFDIPYPGQIVDGIVSAVFSDSMVVELDGKPLAEESYWHAFVEDASPAGGKRIPFRSLLREQMRCAQLKRCAWTLVDMPARGDVQPANRYDEEKSGLLDAYAIALDPRCVTNWGLDARGEELQWAVVRYLDDSQREITDVPGTVYADYTLYTREGWFRWQFAYHPDKPPKDDVLLEAIPGCASTEGTYGFGKVPLVRHELPDGLWSMGKLEPLAIEHLNKENATAWGEYRALFSLVCFYLKGTPGDPEAEAARGRALATRVGPGRGFVGTEGDKVEVVSSPTEPIVAGRAGGDRKRDEMFRVVHQMSQSVDTNSSAALKRSGVSKKEDKKGEALVYEALGELVCEWGLDILLMAAAGRGEPDAELTTKGMNSYDDVSLESLVDQEAIVETIPIRSQTFQKLRQSKFARRYLGEDATDEVMAQIDAELEENISAEEFSPIVQADPNVVDENGETIEAPPPPVHGPKAKPPRGLS